MQNIRHLPLEGVTVIEITTSWAGPLCGAMLADMGAEVIKFENPLSPDISRDSPPFADKIQGLNRSGWFAIHNRGKKDCLLDLKLPENVEIIKQLVKTSDIVIENFAPRVMDSLGLDYSDLKEIKKDIIMISLSGYGATGPDKDCVAFGENIEAQSGLSALIGSPGSPPQGCGMIISDQISGMLGAYVTLSALHYRDLTGQGQHVDLSELEALLSCMPEAILEFTMNGRIREKQGNRDDIMAPHGCYRCKGEDRWVAIAVQSEEEWKKFCLAMNKPQLIEDERFSEMFQRQKNQDALNEIIAGWTIKLSVMDVMTELQKIGIASGPVYNGEQLYNDPHLRDRGFFVEINHPEVGKRRLPGLFARLTETPGAIGGPDPILGEHSDWLLHERIQQDK